MGKIEKASKSLFCMEKQTYVFKFGGSCFKDKDSFGRSLKIIEKYKDNRLIIVCSALMGVTNQLIDFGNAVYQTEGGDIKHIVENIISAIIKKHDDTIMEAFDNDPQYTEKLKQYVRDQMEKLQTQIHNIQNFGFSEKYFDFVVHFGERMSTYLLSHYLKFKNLKSEYISTEEDFIKTNSVFTNALPKLDICEQKISARLNPLLDENNIICVTGYYGSNDKGEITTLGRGGTDFSATIVAYSLKQKEEQKVTVIFWKDVDGILAASPKLVPEAKILSSLSYREARELAFFGSKILHPLCLITAEKKNVKTEIRNFENPDIIEHSQIVSATEIAPNGNIIKAVTSLEQIALVTVEGDAMVSLPGAAANLFRLMGENNINITFISQSSSENNITFATAPENAEKVKKILADSKYFKKQWFSINIDSDTAIIAVVGMGMLRRKGIAGRVFTLLGEIDINIIAIAQGSSEMNITMVIHKDDVKKAVNALYHEFIH